MKTAIILGALFLNQQISAATYEYGEEFGTYVNCDGSKAYPFCSRNDESPINIQTSKTKDGEDSNNFECDEELDWKNLRNSGKKVVKKEHTIEVEADKHGIFENPVDVELRNAVENFCLEQVHFHWGLNNNEGSEHTLNGRRFPLEAHFVHYNCERESVTDVQNQYDTIAKLDAARAAGIDTHELGVIGVWFEITEEENPAIEVILDNAEKIRDEECLEKTEFTSATCPDNVICQQNAEGFLVDCICKDGFGGKNCEIEGKNKETEQEDVDLDLTDILSESVQEKGYWTYEGSLTTPPCTDDVRWFIMKGTSYLSQTQMNRFRAIKRPCSDELIAPNFRPVQGNVNAVYSCGDDDDDSDDSDDSDEKETVTIEKTVNGKRVKVELAVEVDSDENDNGNENKNEKKDGDDDTEKSDANDDAENATGNVETGVFAVQNDDAKANDGDEAKTNDGDDK